MFEKHELFICPAEDTVLWRYLDFTKFASLLVKRAMYFCRSDLLGDPFEGSYPKGSLKAREQHLKKQKFSESLLRKLKAYSQNSRHQMYVNCWHMNPNESEAMWNLHTSNGRTKEGIAIRTTFKRLKDSFNATDKPIFIGKIFYIDYNNSLWMSKIINPDNEEETLEPFFGGGFYPVLHKRISFEHERELRCLFWEPHRKNGIIDLLCQDINNGHYIEVDLDCLIEAVYISPNAAAWFKELTEITIKNSGYAFEIIHSDQEPVF